MHTSENMEERLWGYIDGTATNSEKEAVTALIAENAEWKEKYNELLHINGLLYASELEMPSMRFSKNVMEQISRIHIAPAAKSYINRKIIWGIGFFFIAMLLGFLVYGFSQMSFTTTGAESVITKNLSKVDFSKFFNNTWVNMLLMVNVVLALVLIDNYLTNKRKQYRKEA